MSRIEWGVKRRCAKCDAPFYDMLRYPIRCPKCDAVFRADAPLSRRAATKRPVRADTRRPLARVPAPTIDAPAPDPDSRNEAGSEVVDDAELDEDVDDDVLETDDEDDAAANDDDDDGVAPDEDETLKPARRSEAGAVPATNKRR